MKKAALLALGCLAFWAATYFLWQLCLGEGAGLRALIICGLCLVPSVGTLLWAHWAMKDSPLNQMAAVLGGSMIRMAVALGGCLALTSALPESFPQSTWIMLAVFYLWTLGLEIYLVLSLGKTSSPGGQNHNQLSP